MKLLWLFTFSLFTLNIFAAQTVRLEAEDATRTVDALITTNGSASGGKYVQTKTGNLTWNFDLASAGSYDVYVSHKGSDHKENTILINGSGVTLVTEKTSSWGVEKIAAFANFSSGSNTIEFQKSWGWIDLDYIELVPVDASDRFNLDQSLCTPNATTEAKEIYQFMLDNYGKNILSGIMTDANTSMDMPNWLLTNTGEEPVVLGLDYIHCNRNYGWYDETLVREYAKEWYERGGIPHLMWHWRDPSRKSEGFYDDATSNSPTTDFDISKVNQPNSAEYKAMIADIDWIAEDLLWLQERNIPVIWRPLHEADGNWFWWGAGDKSDCKKLWQIMYDRMVNHHGLKNLIWCWTGQSNSDLYPGDDYVDIIGIDHYPTEVTFDSRAVMFNTVNAHYNGTKMLCFSEIGPQPDPDNLVADEAFWNWMMPWCGDFVTDGKSNPLTHWQKIMKHDYVIVLDEMEGWGKTPPEEEVKPLAHCHSKYLGCIMPSSYRGYVVHETWGKYWNQVTPENAGKWGSCEPTRDNYDWADLDEMYNYAIANDIPFKQHVFVWGTQQPEWIAGLSIAEQRDEIEEWYSDFAARYPKTAIIDVVNESLEGHAPDLGFLAAMGGHNDGASQPFLAANADKYGPYNTGWDFIIFAFAKARHYFPNAQLVLNDYNIINDVANINAHLEIVKILKDRGLIDVVGFQGHDFSMNNLSASQLQKNLDLLASAGLPVHLTELDMSAPTPEALKLLYEEKFPVIWEHPAIEGVTLWGYIEGHNWIENGGLIKEDGTELAPMIWLKEYLACPDESSSFLKTLETDQGSLTPTFRKSVYEYDVVILSETTNIPQITAAPEFEGATVTITQATEFPGTATVEVTSKDGSSTKTYTINYFDAPMCSNSVSNDEFETNTSDWAMQKNEGATGSISVSSNKPISGSKSLKATITNAGTDVWHLQITHEMPIVSGTRYYMSFKAKADAARDITAVVQQNAGSYTTYFSQLVNLTTVAQKFELEFVATTNDALALFRFYLGGNNIGVTIDDIWIAECEEIEVPTEKTQTIDLVKGWNFISTNIVPVDSKIETIFAGLDVELIKNADDFWKKDQASGLNGLHEIEAAEAYLVYMNAAGTLSISGSECVVFDIESSLKQGWNMVGCPMQSESLLSTLFSHTKTELVKDFEGFYEPNGTLNSITEFEPGKGYFVKKK